MKSRKITYISLFCALALVLGYLESLIPPVVPVPGIKLGLSNIVILFAILRIGTPEAFYIMAVKVVLSGLLFGSPSSIIYSASGGILSVLAMLSASKLGLSVIGASISGGVFHNIGQVAAASLMLGSSAAFSYLPVLLISGLFVGVVTGGICKAVISRVKY